jgi:hypothetical protein
VKVDSLYREVASVVVSYGGAGGFKVRSRHKFCQKLCVSKDMLRVAVFACICFSVCGRLIELNNLCPMSLVESEYSSLNGA